LTVVLLLCPAAAGAQEATQFPTIHATWTFPDEILFTVIVESQASEIVDLELSYRVTGNPYTRSRWPAFTPGQRVEATFRLDAQIEHYLPGTEFRYYWTATDAAGHVAESPEQTFVYDDNRFTWQQSRTERVAVFWYAGDDAFGQKVLDTASRALERLEREAGVQAERLIRIYLYEDEEVFQAVLGPNSPEWIGGQALPSLSIIVAQLPPWSAEEEIGRMIPHELSHVVLYQATHNPYKANPNWLEEGIAVHNEEVLDTGLLLLVEETAREDALIPLGALSASFPSDPDMAILSYAESLSVVEFILARYGEEGLSALVDVFAEGETAEAGVQRALGISLEELEALWRETLPAPDPQRVASRKPATPSEGDWLRIVLPVTIALVAIISGTAVLIKRRRALQGSELPEEPPTQHPWG
jgi:hypothetical protein